MKNILFLTAFYKPFIGGAERFAEECVTHRPATINLTVFTARMRRSLPRLEKSNGVIIRRIGLGISYDKFLFPFLAAVYSLFGSYDYVYAVMESYAGCGAFFIHTLKGVPYILNMQSGTLDMPRKKKIIRYIFPLYRAIHIRAWKVHAASASLASRARALGVSQQKISIIPNGIHYARYAKDVPDTVSGRIVVAARLEEPKGIRYAIEAMKYIMPVVPHARLIIAGDGSLRSALEDVAREHGASHIVSFLGMVDPSAMPAFLRTGSCCVCPSIAEGFGISILEAMAAGVPVVATAVGGIPDIIADDACGMLVPPRDPHALARAIVRVLSDESLRSRLIIAGSMRAQSFDVGIIMPRVYGLFA